MIKLDLKKLIIKFILIILIITLISIYLVKKFQENIFEKSIFIPKQSLPVNELVKFDENKIVDFSGKNIPLNSKKIFIFSNKNCGSCHYLIFPVIEWVKTVKNVLFIYIELSNQLPIIYSECKEEDNFYLILDKNFYLYNLFSKPHFPSIFFINENNKIVWKRTGFLILHYQEFTNRIKEFAEGKEIFDDYQFNINIGSPFPQIKYIYKNIMFILPDYLIGKPSLMFFINTSCDICKNIIEQLPSSISKNYNINKFIILSGASQEVKERNLEFAKKFSLKDVELQVKQSDYYKYVTLSYILEKTKEFKSTTIIEDDLYEISKRIGLIGGPYLCILDAYGKIKSINSIGFFQYKDYKNFYKI